MGTIRNEMTIEEAEQYLIALKYCETCEATDTNVCKTCSYHRMGSSAKCYDAIDLGIDIMQRYQKIEDIFYHQTGMALENSLREVIEREKMPIDEAIRHLGTYSSTMGSGQTTQAQHEDAKRVAISTMQKYQKIEQILKDMPCGDEITVRRTQEVVEDGIAIKDIKQWSRQIDYMTVANIWWKEAAQDIGKKYQQLQAEYETHLKADIEAVLKGLYGELKMIHKRYSTAKLWDEAYGVEISMEEVRKKINDLGGRNEKSN